MRKSIGRKNNLVSIYTPTICLHKLDEMYRDFFNMQLRGFHVIQKCDECNGREDKSCYFTYSDLMDKLIDQELLG
jgi:hypothetical protein